MYGSLKKLWKDWSAKFEPGGAVDVFFNEPEYPYYFNFNPKFDRELFDTIDELRCVGGHLQIQSKKSGKPVVVEVNHIFEKNSWAGKDTCYILYRNDLNLTDEVIKGFVQLCSKKALVIKLTTYYAASSETRYRIKREYEAVRSDMKLKWNRYMENK